MKKILILIAASALFFSSCTPVKFYSDPELTVKTGLRVYTAKPFLLAESEPETGRIVKSTIVYLPDLSNPQYMAIKNAPGASKTDLKLNDGIISSFGFEYEQMLPESVEAISSLLSKTAGAIEDINGLKGREGIKASPNTVRLYEIVITREGTRLKEVNPNNN